MSDGPASESGGKPVLTVFSFDEDQRQYSFTSFVTKLHFRLRFAGIPYENARGSRRQAPKDKIPYVRLNETGELMGDSALIAKKLVEMGRMKDLGADLSPETRAMDFCLRSMIEDKMYFLLLHERWHDNYYEMLAKGPFGHLPPGIRHVAGLFVFQYIKLMLYFQGTGRHQPDELEFFRAEAIGALADLATTAGARAEEHHPGSSEPFWILGGPHPTEADFSLFGFLSGLLVTPTQPATVGLIRQHPALVSYVQRIHEAYFPDFHSLV